MMNDLLASRGSAKTNVLDSGLTCICVWRGHEIKCIGNKCGY